MSPTSLVLENIRIFYDLDFFSRAPNKLKRENDEFYHNKMKDFDNGG